MKLLYLHDYKQNLNVARIDELKEQYEVVVPLVTDSDMKNEELVRNIISEFSADYLADSFIAVGEGLGDQEFYPLLDIERVPRKKVVLKFDKQPLEIPAYLFGFLSGDELGNKAEPHCFYVMRAVQKYGASSTESTSGELPIRKTVAIHQRMAPLIYKAVKSFIERNRALHDAWLNLEVTFYHKETGEVLSVYEYCAEHIKPGDSARHLFFNLNLPYSLRLKDSRPISEWQQSLDERYNLDWDELMNMGEVKLRFKTKHGLSESFED